MRTSGKVLVEITPLPTIAKTDLMQRLHEASDLLELIEADRTLLDHLPAADRERLHRAVAQLYNPDPVARRRRQKAAERARGAAQTERDEALLHQTGIRALRRKVVFTTPNVYAPERFQAETGGEEEKIQPQHCYVCKEKYTAIHHFYDQMCPACAVFNFAKRTEVVDLTGRVALLTGGRVKIGYQTGLKLLRAGAHVIVTTRFPRDSYSRYVQEPDFDQWSNRLQIHGLDLRHIPSVEAFCRQLLATHSRLDFVINNACQTVRRPPAFYTHMLEGERHLLTQENASAQVIAIAPELSQVALLPEELIDQAGLFPLGALDQDLQQIDLRGRNSWRLQMDEVSTVELLEVQLINAIAPYVISARLKALMLRTPNRDKHIVNVSAVEGQFYRNWKTTRHPHTNMAKAALNMLTRTAAQDFVNDGIHMNSVDTGWVTDEDPAAIAARKTAEQRFHPPLDIVDGAARILDPIISGIKTGTHIWGQFLKDYRPADW